MKQVRQNEMIRQVESGTLFFDDGRVFHAQVKYLPPAAANCEVKQEVFNGT
jgi:hypothetical protein